MSAGEADLEAPAEARLRGHLSRLYDPADAAALRTFNSCLAGVWCVLFIVLALRSQLQLYGDGSLFAYAIAVQDAWAFHWHNIAGRSFVYVYAHLPAEAYVAATGDIRTGINIYGLLFFAAPLLSLAATYALDRTARGNIFAFACLSTTALLPLIYGFPSEMWIAHALFWPTLALCLDTRNGLSARCGIVALLAALGMTHGGGVVLALAIVAITALCGVSDVRFKRAALSVLPGAVMWAVVLRTCKPDSYFAAALSGAAYNFIDIRNFDLPVTRLLLAALVSYAILFTLGRRWKLANCHLKSAGLVAAGLLAYWVHWDRSVLTEMRYPLRTAIFACTPLLGLLAAARSLRGSGLGADDEGCLDALRPPVPFLKPALERLLASLDIWAKPRLLAGALMLVALIHTVETAKFAVGWEHYKAAVRALAMSDTSDPELGNARFTSTARLRPEVAPFAWDSTTHFLSVLLADGFKPRRVVIDPDTNYFWLSCATATANLLADRTVPVESRQLIRTHACHHR